MDPASQIKALQSFNFVASTLNNEKDKQLYEQMSKADNDTSKKSKKKIALQPAPCEKGKTRHEVNAKIDALHSGFSTRLQSENPFDEFREAVEKAILDKSKNDYSKVEVDRDFYKESDDAGMCLSMH